MGWGGGQDIENFKDALGVGPEAMISNLRVDLLKELKKLAIDMDKRHNDLLEDAIERYLMEHRKGKK